jgi:hypothetical protein
MSKQQSKTRQQKSATAAQRSKTRRASRQPLDHRIAENARRLPRLLRILVTLLFAMAVALDVGLLLYIVEPRFLFAAERSWQTATIVISVGVGFAMYLAGFRLYIGFPGEAITTARRALLWYLGIGAAALVVATLWFVQVITTLNTPL